MAAWHGAGGCGPGHANLVGIAGTGLTLELIGVLCRRLAEALPRLSDPDMALNNLERFIRAARSPLSLGALIERDPEALAILLQMFSSSQHLSDVLIREPESYDLLRITEGQPVSPRCWSKRFAPRLLRSTTCGTRSV